jgi:hypothetical protein
MKRNFLLNRGLTWTAVYSCPLKLILETMKFISLKPHLLSNLLIVFLTSVTVLTVGCESTSTIQTVKKDNENFAKRNTFAFVAEERSQIVPGVNPAELLWTQEIVEIELARRGFQQSPLEEADMLVSIETEITGGREKGGFSIGLGTGSYNRRGGSSVGVSTGPIGAAYIEQSTLTIRVIDPLSIEILWVGWIDKLENKKFSEDEFKLKIREIMRQFPVE